MARIASTTTSGVQQALPTMTLDALMARQKELAAQRGEIAAPRQMTSPWQGAAQLAQTFVNARQEAGAADELAEGRQQLAQLIGGIDPEKGATQQQIAQMGLYDSAAAQRAQENAASIIRERHAREAAIADREDTQAYGTEERVGGQQFTHGENVSQQEAATAAADAQRKAAAALQEDQQAATSEAATIKRQQELQDPTTTQGKIMRDFQSGMYGDPTKPEAAARRDAALAKENAVSGGVTINTGDSGDLRKGFNKNVGEKLFPQYLAEASTAGGQMRGMELLDALASAPQGPLVGRLAEMFPGFDSSASAFQSIVKKLAPAQREPGSGSTSDIEYQGMLDSLPNLINNPAANALISEMVKAQAEIAIARGNVVTRWQSGDLDDAGAFKELGALNGRSIMSPKLKAMIDAVQTNKPIDAGGSDPEVDELLKKYPAGGGQ